MSCCLSPGGALGDGVTLGVEAGLISEVVDGLNFAVLVGVGVGAADDHDGVWFVLFIQGFLQLSILLTVDSVLSLETVSLKRTH